MLKMKNMLRRQMINGDMTKAIQMLKIYLITFLTEPRVMLKVHRLFKEEKGQLSLLLKRKRKHLRLMRVPVHNVRVNKLFRRAIVRILKPILILQQQISIPKLVEG